MLRTNGSVKPLSADAAINIIDAHAADGKIKVRAEAVAFVQCVGEDGLYIMLRAKEPFEEEIDVTLRAGAAMPHAPADARHPYRSLRRRADFPIRWI